MQICHDTDANLDLLTGRRIAVIGYGNQGRAQARNLQHSNLSGEVTTACYDARHSACHSACVSGF